MLNILPPFDVNFVVRCNHETTGKSASNPSSDHVKVSHTMQLRKQSTGIADCPAIRRIAVAANRRRILHSFLLKWAVYRRNFFLSAAAKQSTRIAALFFRNLSASIS